MSNIHVFVDKNHFVKYQIDVTWTSKIYLYMQWIIQSPHINVSANTKNAIIKKFNRFEHFYDRIEQGTIVLKKEKNNKQENYIVEARLAIPNNDLFAREQCSSFEIAAEKVCLDLENQLKKRKRKLKQPPAELNQNMSDDENE